MSDTHVDNSISELPSESLPPDSQYMIQLVVSSNGFEVNGPLPAPAQPQDKGPHSEQQDEIPDLTTAIKHILAIIKANPQGDNGNDQMDAGFTA